ncbi:hypothetical protein CIB84_017215 [Bambusicola thoracicus]|uniref:Uncharacterized protein n=1 Tax=Bambusicola thoracicus TaxID=9083 RepID=A0A2P4S4K2_BAMTH|nr:hypothetical protein CIB84_017215 [Bambusicola thoracicus]
MQTPHTTHQQGCLHSVCSLRAPSMFAAWPRVFPACLLHASACSLHALCMYFACFLHALRMSLHTLCMLTACTLHSLYVFMACSLHTVHSLYLHALCMHFEHANSTQGMCTVCSLHVHCVLFAHHALHTLCIIHYMHIARSQHVPCMHFAHSSALCMFPACTLHVPCMLPSHSLHTHVPNCMLCMHPTTTAHTHTAMAPSSTAQHSTAALPAQRCTPFIASTVRLYAGGVGLEGCEHGGAHPRGTEQFLHSLL